MSIVWRVSFIVREIKYYSLQEFDWVRLRKKRNHNLVSQSRTIIRGSLGCPWNYPSFQRFRRTRHHTRFLKMRNFLYFLLWELHLISRMLWNVAIKRIILTSHSGSSHHTPDITNSRHTESWFKRWSYARINYDDSIISQRTISHMHLAKSYSNTQASKEHIMMPVWVSDTHY